MPKGLKFVAAVMVAVASAAIGWFGVKWWQDTQDIAAPTVSPSPTTSDVAYVRLSFSVGDVVSQVSRLIPHPACGESWAADSAEVNGVKISASAQETHRDGVQSISITAGYSPAGSQPVPFLGAEGDFIVTRDGVIVSPDWGAEFVPQYYVAAAGAPTAAGSGVTLTGAALCDVADDLSAIWSSVDFETANPEDIEAAQAAADAFTAEHAQLPPGEYKIYAVAPVMLGEAAAIARALSDEGVNNVGTLSYSIGESPLADDPRIAQYCEDEKDPTGQVVARNCAVPNDVLTDVLTRDVPAAYVVDGAPALAVSEPVVIVID